MTEHRYLQHKNKKKKKYHALLIAAAALLLCFGILFLRLKAEQDSNETESTEESVVLRENQSWLYLGIESITGNEIQARVVGHDSEMAGQDKGGREISGTKRENIKTDAMKPDTGAGAETGTYLIPVGTEVVTGLGSVTTFSRLAAGDVIHCLTEETEEGPVILKIWIAE